MARRFAGSAANGLIVGIPEPVAHEEFAVLPLCHALGAILQIHEAKQYNLYYEDMPTFDELLRQLGTILNRNVLFVPVPAAFLLLPLSVLRYLRIRPPIDVDNLKGYITNLAPYHPTNLSSVLARSSTLQAALAEAWEKAKYMRSNAGLDAWR